MKNVRFFPGLLIISVIFGIIISGGCKKDDPDEMPELPPIQSLLMDFSDFNDAADTLTSKKVLPSYTNWGKALTTVALWNTVISVTVAVPVAAYAEALSQTPVYLGDNRWEWKYSVTVNSITYNAVLQTQRISNEEFTAEMFITRSGAGGFSNFKWFEGTIRYDHTHAIWTLYESPANPAELLSVEWNYNWEEETGDITYTLVKTGHAEEDSYIRFSVDPLSVYDAGYVISLSTGQAQIEWNRTTRAGRIQSQVLFGDTLWHCWNQYLQNTDCPGSE